MKNYITVLLLLFITALEIFAQTLEEREKEIAENNDIKTKIQYDYKYINGELSETGIKSSSTTYSQRGEILAHEYYNSKGEITGWEKYEYDERNNRTLYERENTSSKYKKATKYSESNDIVLEAGFNGAENFRNEYTYTAPGKPLIIKYSISNTIMQIFEYKHSGNTATISIYAGDGTSLTSRMKLVYSNNNIIEETTLSVDNKELETKKYTYNRNSQILTEEKYRQGNLHYRISYDYNSRGDLIRVSEETPSKKKYAKKVYNYAASGNMLEYKWRRNPDDEFNIKTYAYNSKGICLTEHTLYPKTKYEQMSRFKYTYY